MPFPRRSISELVTEQETAFAAQGDGSTTVQDNSTTVTAPELNGADPSQILNSLGTQNNGQGNVEVQANQQTSIDPLAQTQQQPHQQQDAFSALDPNTLSPELQGTYKSLQADYTRKMQDLATARRQVEGIQPELLETARYVQTMQSNPQALVSYLLQQGQIIAQQHGLDIRGFLGQPQADPQSPQSNPLDTNLELDTEFVTPNETALMQEIRTLKEYIKQSVTPAVQQLQPVANEHQAAEIRTKAVNLIAENGRALGYQMAPEDIQAVVRLGFDQRIQDVSQLSVIATRYAAQKLMDAARQSGHQAGEQLTAAKIAANGAVGQGGVRVANGGPAVNPIAGKRMTIAQIAELAESGAIR